MPPLSTALQPGLGPAGAAEESFLPTMTLLTPQLCRPNGELICASPLSSLRKMGCPLDRLLEAFAFATMPHEDPFLVRLSLLEIA
jgi:hypothetical protein